MRNAETKALEDNEDMVRAIVVRSVPTWARHFEDAMQEGRIALLEAVRSWDPNGGASLRTWAGPRIQWKIWAFDEQQYRPLGYSRQARARKGESFDCVPETVSLDCPFDPEAGEDKATHEVVASFASNPEELLIEKQEREGLHRALAKLPASQARILRKRFAEESTLREIGAGLGVTRERVRQIEVEAISALGREMKRAS